MFVMAAFAKQVRVRVGRLVPCSSCGGGARLSLWICVVLVICNLLLCQFGSNVGALSPDGQVLMSFATDYMDIQGLCQGDLASWNGSDDTPCGWLRVFCTPDNAVRRLDFSGCSLGNFDSYFLAELGSLKELDLSFNPDLTPDIVGGEIAALTELTWLDTSGSYTPVYQNPFNVHLQYLYGERVSTNNGVMPRLVGLGELLFLSLAHSGFQGAITEDVGTLTQIVSLDLSDNFLQGSVPNMEGLTRLAHLSLTANNLSGDVPAPPNLQYLDAANNYFSNLTYSFLQISALKSVNLARNQLGGQLLDTVELKSSSVEKLDLSWNGMQGHIPSSLAQKVSHLDLSHNTLSGTIPSGHWRLGAHYVDLSANALQGNIPATLLSARVTTLNLSGNALDGNIPDRPTDNFSLSQILDLSHNQLNGSLPTSFCNSPSPYSILWLQNNQFSGDLVPLLSAKLSSANSMRVQDNRFTGDLTEVLDSRTLEASQSLQVWDLSHNNLTMIPSQTFPDPLQTILEQLCGTAFILQELRLAGTDLMRQPLPARLNCSTSMVNLEILDLASCNLDGPMPEALFNVSMPSLTFLNVSSNTLSGAIPGRLPITLGLLDLSSNNMEGEMPEELFTDLHSLVHFNASNNKLSGPIPDSFPLTLQVLDLSHNSLRGGIPGKLFFGLLNLTYIDLSSNNLSGPIPDGLNPALFKASSFADNPGLCGGPLPPCRPKNPAGIKVWQVVTLVVAAVLVCTAGSCLLLAWRRRVYSKKHQQDADLIAMLLERETVTVMTLRELRKATSNFSEAAQIGAGGFGTVYSGNLADGTAVAIKKSKREGSAEYKKQFLNEVKILSGVNHRHLVKLLGCSMEDKIALLVFEFVPNGTLQEHLGGKRHGLSPLTWRQRLLIALQTADALAYLHSAADPPIFHRDVKSSNILLDDDLNAKVADFGISKLAPSKAADYISTANIQGTWGYIDPEYFGTHQLTARSDVYSFGVVLLELISSKPAVVYGSENDATSLASLVLSTSKRGEWGELVDPVLADTFGLANGKASIASVGNLAVRCLAPTSRERPEMKEVRNELQTLWLHCDPDASFQWDEIRHSVQNAEGDVETSYDFMALLTSHSSLWSSSSKTSFPEIEMQHP